MELAHHVVFDFTSAAIISKFVFLIVLMVGTFRVTHFLSASVLPSSSLLSVSLFLSFSPFPSCRPPLSLFPLPPPNLFSFLYTSLSLPPFLLLPVPLPLSRFSSPPLFLFHSLLSSLRGCQSIITRLYHEAVYGLRQEWFVGL